MPTTKLRNKARLIQKLHNRLIESLSKRLKRQVKNYKIRIRREVHDYRKEVK